MKLIGLEIPTSDITKDTETEMWFYCGCASAALCDRKRIAIRGAALSYGDMCGAVTAAGWVVGEPNIDKDGAPHVTAFCSARCHNEHVLEIAPARRRGWWNAIRAIEGSSHPDDMPACICIISKNADGLFRVSSAAACPWHTWAREYTARANVW